jgi:hypothetical protein
MALEYVNIYKNISIIWIFSNDQKSELEFNPLKTKRICFI